LNTNGDIYTDEDFEHGLRCGECDTLFVEGQPISERLTDFIEETPVVELVCVPCGMRGALDG
jgi:hypothetical protein